jgi:hypothetical protein
MFVSLLNFILVYKIFLKKEKKIKKKMVEIKLLMPNL